MLKPVKCLMFTKFDDVCEFTRSLILDLWFLFKSKGPVIYSVTLNYHRVL